MSDAPELLPCPFCGCTTIVKAAGPRATVPFYECDWCGAEGPAEEPEADPPQGWNVRATPAALAASPEVQEMIREAEIELLRQIEMEWRVHPSMDGARRNLQSRITALQSIRAEAAALRGKETT